jgi:hypothetical protein
MTTTVKALQKLSCCTMQGELIIEEFVIEPGQSFEMLSGNGYLTAVRPARLAEDEALVVYGFGAGKKLEAAARMERYVAHLSAGRDVNDSPYGRLYE